MKIRVSRRRWLRGSDNSCLLNSQGKMCCLGFGARQCGVLARDIRGKLMPSNIPEELRTKALWESPLLDDEGLNSQLSSEASGINDNEKYTDRERETKLRELFRQHGHQIVFVP